MNNNNVVHYLNHLHVIHLSELFTYPNTFLRPMARGGSDKRGSTVLACALAALQLDKPILHKKYVTTLIHKQLY